jgi:cytochrome b
MMLTLMALVLAPALAAIHALAAVIIGRWQRVTLVRAMVTGFKRFY